jgi:uncharacterized protein (DUF1330 family)
MAKLTLTLTMVGIAVVGVIGAWAAAQDAPKKAYMVVQLEISNPQQYGEYMKFTPGVIDKFGGRFIARGGRSTTLEGPPAPGRIVIVEFPSYERAQEFYSSPDYLKLRKLREGAATAQFVVVEGM